MKAPKFCIEIIKIKASPPPTYLLRADVSVQLHQWTPEQGHGGEGAQESIGGHDQEENMGDTVDHTQETHQFQGIFQRVTDLQKFSQEPIQMQIRCDRQPC